MLLLLMMLMAPALAGQQEPVTIVIRTLDRDAMA